MSTLYIPPPEISFRLLGFLSQYVLFSRNVHQPEVYHHPMNQVYPDHWFQLLPGSGKHDGCYAIKSKHTGNVLFSRNDEPHVGHVGGDGQYDDNWFRLEPGTGKLANNFRLRNPGTNTVLFSRHVEPQVDNYNPANHTPADDQYFSFLFEDMRIDRVEYKVNEGRIVRSTPIVISIQTTVNNTNTPQTMSFMLNETIIERSSFQYKLGFLVKVGTKGKIGIPFVAEGKISVEVSNSHEFTWGTELSVTKRYTESFELPAPPYSTVRSISTVTRSDFDIPYVMYLKSVSTGHQVTSEGIYRGSDTWGLRHTPTSERMFTNSGDDLEITEGSSGLEDLETTEGSSGNLETTEPGPAEPSS